MLVTNALLIGILLTRWNKERLTAYCLRRKLLVKHFQAAGMRCSDQHALENFIKNDFIGTR